VEIAIYLVDRYLPDITQEELVALQRAAIATSERYTVDGTPVRYLRTTFVPSESHCMSLFEAPNAKVVQEVNEAAQLPFTRIVEALDVPPQSPQPE
jgi:hypothetical protein